MSFFHTKSVAQLENDAASSSLTKNLTAFDLTFLGVGGIIGAGIFVLTGIAAARYAGPGLALSFVIAGVLCILVGLTYSEFASIIPASGSVYSYTFASLGEGMAFLCVTTAGVHRYRCGRSRWLFRIFGRYDGIPGVCHS
jgi:APA family basic amino acid/polyamine antiporter